jgi:hypothetical protein
MKQDILKWIDSESLEFKNQEFEEIDLSIKFKGIPEDIDINTELIFSNCRIDSFSVYVQLLNRKLVFNECIIGKILFFGTHLIGGFEMRNCVIENLACFDAIGHNINPNKFIVDSCTFNVFANFFDCWFEGPVNISNNNFKQGTNIGFYLNPPYGIEAGLEFKLENNIGNIYLENEKENT